MAPWTEVSVALTGSGGYYLEKTSLRSLQQAPPHSFLKTKQNKTNFDFDASVQMSQAELNEALEIVYFKLFFPMLSTSTCPFACEVTHILRAIGPTGPFPLTGRARLECRWLPKQIPALSVTAKAIFFWSLCVWPECSPRKPHKPCFAKGNDLCSSSIHQELIRYAEPQAPP